MNNASVNAKGPVAVGRIPWIYNRPPGDQANREYRQTVRNQQTTTVGMDRTERQLPAGRGRRTKRKTLRRKSMRLRRK
jgi:hypothetical protein